MDHNNHQPRRKGNNHAPSYCEEARYEFSSLKSAITGVFGYDPAENMNDNDVETVARRCSEIRIKDAEARHCRPST